MKHRVGVVTFGRNLPERISLFKNLVTSLLKHERIVTTVSKAMEVRRFAERVRLPLPLHHLILVWHQWMCGCLGAILLAIL